MNEGRAKTLVVATVGGAGVLAVLEHISEGRRPPLSVGVGVAVSGVLLLALAEVAPELAAAFGGLLLAGALLRNGTAATAAVSQTFTKG